MRVAHTVLINYHQATTLESVYRLLLEEKQERERNMQ